MSYDIVCPNTRSGLVVATISAHPPPPNACQHGLGLSYASFITFMPPSQLEGMKHALVLLLTPRTAMATWEKDSPYAN